MKNFSLKSVVDYVCINKRIKLLLNNIKLIKRDQVILKWCGAKAFRQAIDIGMTDISAATEDFEDYVEDHEDEYPELTQAMKEWGISDTRF